MEQRNWEEKKNGETYITTTKNRREEEA